MEKGAFVGTGEIGNLLEQLRAQKEQLEVQKRLLVKLEHGSATDVFPEDKRGENIRYCQAAISGIQDNLRKLEEILGPDVKKY